MSRIKDLLQEYLAGPSDLRASVRPLSKEQALTRPIPGKMSTLEVVCHLADFDPIMADRMKRVISMENPTLIGADENQFIKCLVYQDRDMQEELSIIELTRGQMGRILEKLDDTVLKRAGNHTERGQVTLEQLLEVAIRHIRHHLGFIEEKKKALGIENVKGNPQNRH